SGQSPSQGQGTKDQGQFSNVPPLPSRGHLQTPVLPRLARAMSQTVSLCLAFLRFPRIPVGGMDVSVRRKWVCEDKGNVSPRDMPDICHNIAYAAGGLV